MIWAWVLSTFGIVLHLPCLFAWRAHSKCSRKNHIVDNANQLTPPTTTQHRQDGSRCRSPRRYSGMFYLPQRSGGNGLLHDAQNEKVRRRDSLPEWAQCDGHVMKREGLRSCIDLAERTCWAGSELKEKAWTWGHLLIVDSSMPSPATSRRRV